MFLERVQVRRHVTPRQQTSVDGGMQRLHPAVQHFREARHVRHLSYGDAGGVQRAEGATGAHQLRTSLVQRFAKLFNSSLVRDA